MITPVLDLEGKWLAIWLSPAEVFSVFALPPTAHARDHVWLLGGRSLESLPVSACGCASRQSPTKRTSRS
jgi:hypothetical protein